MDMVMAAAHPETVPYRDMRRLVFLAAMETEMACQMTRDLLEVFNPQKLFPATGQQGGRVGQLEELWQDFVDVYRSLVPELVELDKARIRHARHLWSLPDERATTPPNDGPVLGLRHPVGPSVDG